MILKHPVGEGRIIARNEKCSKLFSTREGDERWEIKQNCVREVGECGRGPFRCNRCGRGTDHDEGDP